MDHLQFHSMSADPKLQIPFTFKAAAAVAAVGFDHTTVVTSRE
jgi:hypothetical protein